MVSSEVRQTIRSVPLSSLWWFIYVSTIIYLLPDRYLTIYTMPGAILGTWDALLNKINQVFSLHGAEIPVCSLPWSLFLSKYCKFIAETLNLNFTHVLSGMMPYLFYNLDLQH